MMQNRRFVLIVALICFLVMIPLAAKGVKEAVAEAESQQLTVEMAVMQGPSGFGSVGLQENDGKINENTTIKIQVYPSPNEVIARLANGELDIAALPTNVAANLYAKGVPVKVAAITGEGMLMFLTTDSSISDLSDLEQRKINIPGAGGTPDQMTRILVSALGFDPEVDVELDYSIASPAQLAQMLIAQKIELAVLPEPFVSMATQANASVFPLLDMQALWSALTGTGNYPMTVVVVSDKFVAKYGNRLPVIMDAIRDSVLWVNENPVEAGVKIEEAGIMKAAMATPAIPRCNLVFKTATEGYEAMDTYLKILYGFDYSSIGGSVPDESFYLAY